MSTPVLIDNYREAQAWAKRFGEKLNKLRKIERAIDRADTRGSWWSRLEWLGDWVRKKTEYWKAEAHRLDRLRADVETEAESMRTHTQFYVGDPGSTTWLRVEEAFEGSS